MPLLAALYFSGAWTTDMVIRIPAVPVYIKSVEQPDSGRKRRKSRHTPWLP
jgi:hypothetical protein